MGLRSAILRHRVTFQVRSTIIDSVGGQSTNWTDLFTVWAEVSPLTGREQMAAQAVQSETTHQITVRYRSEFAVPKTVAAYRAIYNGRIFNIGGSINQDERNRIVVLSAIEGLTQG